MSGPQLAGDQGALVHFQRLVVHVALDAGLGLQFQQFAGMDRAHDRAIDDDVVGMD